MTLQASAHFQRAIQKRKGALINTECYAWNLRCKECRMCYHFPVQCTTLKQ